MPSFKINLFNKEWMDIVFQNRNKNYGAYWLRKKSAAITAKALLFSSIIYTLLFLIPDMIALFRTKEPEQQITKIVDVTLRPPPPVNPEVPPPAPLPSHPVNRMVLQAPRPRTNLIKFPPPIVKPDEQVRDEAPQLTQLKNADPGQFTIQGDPNADIVITGPVGTGPKQGQVVEDSRVYEFNSLEVLPSFPGGMAKFYQYLQRSIQYPEAARMNNIQGKVFLSFIIEKNGKLTDIKVDHYVGGGLDEEAIRVLKLSPKWNPGIQNGLPVRVKYNLPINFSLSP